jgi:hypothetical protein
MKKSLFFVAAASALMLTACSSENDVVQSATPTQTTVEQKAVGFDVYTPSATNARRAGLQGTMTTNRLQRSEANGGGFGVYSYLVEDNNDALAKVSSYLDPNGDGDKADSYRAAPIAPNFMANEKLLWNTVNQGWYYNPLKYWPNETNNDSQNTNAVMENGSVKHLDRLTFFAYAPYVTQGDNSKPGITYITNKNGKLTTGTPVTGESNSLWSVREAGIGYKAALTNPNQAVDLLWGVAPAGGLTYTAVNGNTVKVNEGEPLMDMTKPNVNTNMKFLFQHALARIGVTAVAAIDQVGAGGTLDPNTKITINEITLTGYFGETGFLNLDNDRASVANWWQINDVDLTGNPAIGGLTKTTLTLNVANSTIAEHLRYVGNHATPSKQESASGKNDRVGVTTVRQNVIEPSAVGGPQLWSSSKTYAANTLKYSESTPYYTDAACTTKATTQQLGTATGRYYTLDQDGVYTQCNTVSGKGRYATYTYPQVMQYYDVTFKKLTAADVTAGTYATYTAYVLDDTKGTSGTWDDGDTFTPKADVPAEGDFVITASELKAPYYAEGTYYTRDANYFMVVPTNNIEHVSSNISASDDKALRTVTVKIEYYITTEDSKLAAGRAQTKNVIEKDVVFPSLANGKSYNLNLILGLTSVKMEAEVDDWKVINVQADLPQNTGE